MDLDPTLRGGLELGLKICQVKTSSQDASKYANFDLLRSAPTFNAERWRLSGITQWASSQVLGCKYGQNIVLVRLRRITMAPNMVMCARRFWVSA